MGNFKGFGKRNTYELDVRMKRRKNGEWVAKVYDEIKNEDTAYTATDPHELIDDVTDLIRRELRYHIEYMAGTDSRPPQDR